MSCWLAILSASRRATPENQVDRLCIGIPVGRWSHWSGPAASAPHPPGIDPILRRRLSPQGRAALASAAECAAGLGSYRMVFASRHGELARTHGLIEALRDDTADDPSPASFTLSVLNSTPAIASIARKDRSPAVAVSAGARTCWLGLLEAALGYHTSRTPVVLVCADAPVPSVFLHGQEDPHPVRSLAVLLADGGTPCKLVGPVEDSSAVEDSFSGLLRCLRGLGHEAIPMFPNSWMLQLA
jgi:hypothetical protein